MLQAIVQSSDLVGHSLQNFSLQMERYGKNHQGVVACISKCTSYPLKLCALFTKIVIGMPLVRIQNFWFLRSVQTALTKIDARSLRIAKELYSIYHWPDGRHSILAFNAGYAETHFNAGVSCYNYSSNDPENPQSDLLIISQKRGLSLDCYPIPKKTSEERGIRGIGVLSSCLRPETALRASSIDGSIRHHISELQNTLRQFKSQMSREMVWTQRLRGSAGFVLPSYDTSHPPMDSSEFPRASLAMNIFVHRLQELLVAATAT